MASAIDKNILVISDLHLGEDLKENRTGTSYLRQLVRLERELQSFLGHYTERRIGDRAWRLVINGDMVDFMSVVILPSEGDASDEERQFGLAHGEGQSRHKLERVVAR